MSHAPIWEQAVQREAMNFVSAVQQNFRHGLQVSLVCLPDQKDHHCRATQLDYFMDALIGVAVQQVSEFATDDPAMEDRVVDSVRKKFEYIRTKKAEHEASVKAAGEELQQEIPPAGQDQQGVVQ